MQVTSNYSPIAQDDFNQPANTSNLVDNKNPTDATETSNTLSSDPYSSPASIANNSVVREPAKQPDSLSNKYQQYTSLESNYFRNLINASVPSKPQNPSQPAASTNSANSTDAKTETAKATNDTLKPAVKDNLDTNWDQVSKNVNQNKYNNTIRKAVEDPNNPFPEMTPIELKALLWQESKFDPTDVNGKSGATGIAQIRSNTAAEGGLKLDGSGKDPRKDPNQAIPAVPKILAKKFDYVNNTYKNREGEITSKGLNYYNQGKPLPREEKLKFALASYNGGHPRIRKALEKVYGDNIPPNGPKFEDIKPYLSKETQNYVPLILERASTK
ncbi:MAG: transglycosylase SLT domain-containing protein [Acidobacteria bacterium]|nr:transglycosylase SLT domain-containing protein [Acidobacteriota bacterium]